VTGFRVALSGILNENLTVFNDPRTRITEHGSRFKKRGGFRFEVLKKRRLFQARLGRIETTHALCPPPAFLPVGTQGTINPLLQRNCWK